jgi:hypothetical protein
LAHRRNADPVGEVDVAHAKFAEQVRHGSIVSIYERGASELAGLDRQARRPASADVPP